jgi:hypothetical protein
MNGNGPTYDAIAIFNGSTHRAKLSVESETAIRIRYEDEPGGCVNTAGPELQGGLDAEGVHLERYGDLSPGIIGWRAIAAPRAYFHASPGGTASSTYVVKGDVVGVRGESQGWVNASFEGWDDRHSSGWIRSDMLFPIP